MIPVRRSLYLLAALVVTASQSHYCDFGLCPTGTDCIRDGPNAVCVCPEGKTYFNTKCIGCEEDTCPAGQTCSIDMVAEDFRCSCPEGQVKFRDTCYPECDNINCPFHSTCFKEDKSQLSCTCNDDEANADGICNSSCGPGSCPYNMRCSPDYGRFRCLCEAPFMLTKYGDCLIPCGDRNCIDDDVCSTFGEVTRCCAPGLLPNPETEECSEPCELDVCPTNTVCSAADNEEGYECKCAASNTCSDDTSCSQDDPNYYKCTCEDSDSCTTCLDNPCTSDKECLTTESGYTCGCHPGHVVVQNGECVDIDECDGEVNPCKMDNALCVNLVGSYQCKCISGTFFNDTSNACQDVNECLIDSCDTKHTGLVCHDKALGFDCLCPQGASTDQCNLEEELNPCCCGTNEVCLRAEDGSFYCDCDQESERLSSGCAAKTLPLAANLDTTKHGTDFSFMIGTRSSIQLDISKTNEKFLHWKHVTWIKKPSRLVITSGRNATKPGRFSTPRFRQKLVVNPVLPEDEGTYEVIVRREGYKTVKATFNVHIIEPLEREGVDLSKKHKLIFKVKVSSKLDSYTLSWLRYRNSRLERLPEDGPASTYRKGGQILITPKIAGVYYAVLEGTVAGFPVFHFVFFVLDE